LRASVLASRLLQSFSFADHHSRMTKKHYSRRASRRDAVDGSGAGRQDFDN
jgi:hypothetical protein